MNQWELERGGTSAVTQTCVHREAGSEAVQSVSVNSTMIAGVSPVVQALLGTLFTWGLTAAGAALVFIFSSRQKRILDGSLGFAAGVMLAASYWSLLAPAIEMAEESGKYGDFAFFPVAVGFTLGALFVYIADLMMPVLAAESAFAFLFAHFPAFSINSLSLNNTGIHDDVKMMDGDLMDRALFCSSLLVYLRIKVNKGVGTDPHMALASDTKLAKEKKKSSMVGLSEEEEELSIRIDKIENGEVYQRRRGPNTGNTEEHEVSPKAQEVSGQTGSSWRRIVLLILAITIHNIPEGLAVGVGFGAIGKTPSATFESARNLAIGIGIQNFPEGLAVSLPLRGSGVSTWRSFWYGQLSGMVEPLAGLLGAVAVVLAEPLLPYALAFAAGAMVYVVVDDIIPEAQVSGNGKLASWTSILGFVVMMSLDVGLG
ncbi:zinc transporter ZIP11 [Labeo rohita]|uniref:Zinc transporter ZIP11 n=1 Tax=Labeo rohita TaxID=84645 RepID=A0A498NAX9_LABRO|nr:zinc transporter ZIP11 [Labeo rohita]